MRYHLFQNPMRLLSNRSKSFIENCLYVITVHHCPGGITQVPRTESIPLKIPTIMSMMKYEFEQFKDWKFEEKFNIHLVPSELLAKQHSQYGHLRPARPALFCWQLLKDQVKIHFFFKFVIFILFKFIFHHAHYCCNSQGY